MSRKIILIAVLAPAIIGARASVVINEVMQSNIYTIMDDLNKFPDSWVELYNDSNEMVSLAGWRIGDDSTFDSAWSIPAATIGPHGYFLLYCDKADTGIHADFRIDSGKNTLTLYSADGSIADHVDLKKQPAPDIAYGRVTDGAAEWGYQLRPSPRTANSGASEVVLPEVAYSVEGGVYTDQQKLNVELSAAAAVPDGTRIIYTIDGREPVDGQCAVYASPIAVTRSQVIRAKAVCDGCISRPSSVQSYIYTDHEMQVPVISIAIPDKYLNDKYIGIFADGTGGVDHENYRYDWRRPMNIEYFAAPGAKAQINQLGEMRVQGGWTRSNPLKSLAVYANKRFGTKRLECEFWQKDKPGVTDNKSIVLRNGGNDFCWAYVRDGLIQRVIGRNTRIDWQAYAPAVVYINGRYHAMLAIRERSNEDNIYANYDGLEDIDMYENWEELKTGDAVERDRFMEWIKTGHTFDEWDNAVDLESYYALMAINYWVYNTDFPDNNTVMWRRRAGDDTRWRWLVKDCDFGIGAWNSWDNINTNFTAYMGAGQGTGFSLYRRIMQCPEVREAFISHLVAWQGDFLNAYTFNAYLDEIMEENHGEQEISHLAWRGKMGFGWSDLNYNISFMHQWIDARHGAMPKLMRNSWGLGQPVTVKVNTAMDAYQSRAMRLSYAGVVLTSGTFSGYDYVGRTISLAARSEDNVTAWRVRRDGAEDEYFEGATLVYPIASRGDIEIEAVIDDTGISDILADGTSISVSSDTAYADGDIAVYDLQGRVVARGSGSVRLPGAGTWIVSASGAARKVTLK